MPASNLVNVAAPNGTEVTLLGPSVKRRRVVLNCFVNSAGMYFRFTSIGNVVGGFFLNNAMAPIILDINEVGDIVKGPIYAFNAGSGTGTAIALETID